MRNRIFQQNRFRLSIRGQGGFVSWKNAKTSHDTATLKSAISLYSVLEGQFLLKFCKRHNLKWNTTFYIFPLTRSNNVQFCPFWKHTNYLKIGFRNFFFTSGLWSKRKDLANFQNNKNNVVILFFHSLKLMTYPNYQGIRICYDLLHIFLVSHSL